MKLWEAKRGAYVIADAMLDSFAPDLIGPKEYDGTPKTAGGKALARSLGRIVSKYADALANRQGYRYTTADRLQQHYDAWLNVHALYSANALSIQGARARFDEITNAIVAEGPTNIYAMLDEFREPLPDTWGTSASERRGWLLATIAWERGDAFRLVLIKALEVYRGKIVIVRKDELMREDNRGTNITIGTRVKFKRWATIGGNPMRSNTFQVGTVTDTASSNSAIAQQAKNAVGTKAAVKVRMDPEYRWDAETQTPVKIGE